MAKRNSVVSPATASRLFRTFGRIEHMPVDRSGTGRKYRGGGGAGSRLRIGIITGHDGAESQSRHYDAEAIDDENITVSRGRPLDQPYDGTFEVHPADIHTLANPSLCTLIRLPVSGTEERWFIKRAFEEYLISETCQQQTGNGSSTEDFTAAQENGPQDAIHPTRITVLESAHAVTSAGNENINVKVYTFPLGAIRILSIAVKGLVLSAPTNTNTLEWGFGTAESTDGTSLTGAEDNVVAGATSAALSSSGLSLSSAFAAIDVDKSGDGRTTAMELWLNIAPTTNWTASEDVTVESGVIDIRWMNMGGN